MKANKSSGFTLIELLLVVAVIAILAAVAYPSYRLQVQQARRAEIQGKLMDLAQQLERQYSKVGQYRAPAPDPNCPDDDATPPPFKCYEYYDVTAENLTGTTYRLKATPKGPQSGTGAVTVDQAQRRSWDENNDGDISDPGEDNWHRG
jgi:type IV pilus assembly protein PilE